MAARRMTLEQQAKLVLAGHSYHESGCVCQPYLMLARAVLEAARRRRYSYAGQYTDLPANRRTWSAMKRAARGKR